MEKTMKPKINSTNFGSIAIKSKTYKHDIIIRKDGLIEKHRQKLSKKIYETSHKISLAETKYKYDKGVKKLIIGTGQTGYAELSKKVEKFSEEKDCKIKLILTTQAIKLWNKSKGKVIAMFHVTC